MALQKQPASLQFAGGVATRQDQKQVPATELLDLQNAVFIKETTLAKRNGYVSLAQTIDTSLSLLTAPIAVANRGDELLAFDGTRCYSRRSSSWADTGEVAAIVGTDVTVARTGTQQSLPEHATNGGVTAIAWEDSRGGVWCSIIDATSRKILLSSTQLDPGGMSPRCNACGTRIHIVWANTAMRHLRIVVVDPLFPESVPVVAELADDLDPANPVFDVSTTVESTGALGLWQSGSPCIVAWPLDTGGLRVGYVHQSGVLGSALTSLPDVVSEAVTVTVGPVAIAFDVYDVQSVCVVYTGTAGAMFALPLAPDLSSLGAATSVHGSAARTAAVTFVASGALAWFAFEIAGGRPDLAAIVTGSFNVQSVAVVTSTAGRTLHGHILLSKAFADGGNAYVAIAHPVKFFPYDAIVRISASTWNGAAPVVARLLPGLSTGQLPQPQLGVTPRSHTASVQPVSPNSQNHTSRQHAVTLGYRIQLSSANGDQFGEAGIRIATLDFNNKNAYQSATLGLGLYLAGALIQHYDGARWAEAGFHCAPDGPGAGSWGSTAGWIVADGGVTPGASVKAGVYGYKACYEEIDEQGELHPGPVAVELLVTVAVDGSQVSVTIPTCRLTAKRNVRIGVFRSIANDQSEFFRVTSTDPTVTAGNNRHLANDSTVDSVTFIDWLDDATVKRREPLYTNGGLLSNDPTASRGDCLIVGKQRLFWTDPSNPNLVRFSKTWRGDSDTGMQESAGLMQDVDPYGGDITALGVLDDAVIAFKQTATHVFAGIGPNDDGGAVTQDAFSPTQLLTSDVGCTSPRGIVQTPIGIMFPTSKGIAMLGRDRQVDIHAGDKVYAYKDQIISRATLLPDRRQIVFLTADTNGRTLLYDYERQQWSTFTNHLGVDASVVNGIYYYVRNDGRVFQETPGIYADDNLHIPMLISTAWIKMAGYLQAFQRVIHASAIGTYKSPHQLSMRFRIDYQDSWSQPILIDMGALYGGSSYGVGNYGVNNYDGDPTPLGTVYQAAWHINRRCQAIAFEFTDVEATATFGAAFELSELLLVGGVLGTRFPVGASRSR